MVVALEEVVLEEVVLAVILMAVILMEAILMEAILTIAITPMIQIKGKLDQNLSLLNWMLMETIK